MFGEVGLSRNEDTLRSEFIRCKLPSDLSGAVFRGGRLESMDLQATNLEGADLSECQLTDLKLPSDLSGVKLLKSRLSKMQSGSMQSDRMPVGGGLSSEESDWNHFGWLQLVERIPDRLLFGWSQSDWLQAARHQTAKGSVWSHSVQVQPGRS